MPSNTTTQNNSKLKGSTRYISTFFFFGGGWGWADTGRRGGTGKCKVAQENECALVNHFSYKTDIFHCKKPTSIHLFQAWTNRLVLPSQVALSFHLKFSSDLKCFYFPLSPKRLINNIKAPSEQIPDPLLYNLLDNWSHFTSCICSNPRWKEKELKDTKIQLLQCIISTGI